MAHNLEVWLFSDFVGMLSLLNGRLSFQYDSDWLVQSRATALSSSLSLQKEAFDDIATRPFFAGLLPEGQMRRLIAQQFKVSGQNDFALLDRIGGECAGAVTFIEPGQSLPAVGNQYEVQWLNDEELVHILKELPRRPMLAGQDGLRLSLAGAQDKLPVVFDGVRIGLPRAGAPSSHILKPAIAAVSDSVVNESFCMSLAGLMGLQSAAAHIHSVGGHSFLLVERYDRIVDVHAQLQRLHQEDFCQALSVVPELKYQNEGGPDLAQCFDLVRRATKPNALHVLRLLDGVIFNVLIGNHDAHGKNFSLLYRDKTPVLAPFYDLLSTAVYPELTPKMAMKIGSKYKFSEVHSRHWEQFAASASLSVAQTKKRVLELCKRLPITARELQTQAPYLAQPIVEQIAVLIEQRAALTIRRLTAVE